MSKTITDSNITEFRNSIKKWKATGTLLNDKEMLRCYKQDRKDLRAVLSLVEKGKYNEAGKKAYWLDTIVRDQIPNTVYDVIMKNT